MVIFEVLPDRKIAWHDVWHGALVTSFLFVVGQFLLGWYLSRAGLSTAYGAFGSFIVFLLWANYSAQIVLFGAEFTNVYAKKLGSIRHPESKAA
jgi:membrane protein